MTSIAAGMLRQKYQDDGFLVVEKVMPEPVIIRLRSELDRLCADALSLAPHLREQLTFERDLIAMQPGRSELSSAAVGDAVYMIGDLAAFGGLFVGLINYAPVLDLVEALFGSSEFEFQFYQALIKQAHVGSRLSWHRDIGNPVIDCLTHETIRVMLCLDDTTAANGATQVVRGSHRVGEEEARAQMRFREPFWTDEDVITLECPAGSAVVLSSRIIHGGGPNRSLIPRRNLISGWSGPANHPVTTMRFTAQGLMPRSRDPYRQLQSQSVFASHPDLSLQTVLAS